MNQKGEEHSRTRHRNTHDGISEPNATRTSPKQHKHQTPQNNARLPCLQEMGTRYAEQNGIGNGKSMEQPNAGMQ